MPQAQRQHRFAVILAFALVYFFWGSTYLGIDIAVEHIPPALMCGMRFSDRRWIHAGVLRAARAKNCLPAAPAGSDGGRGRAAAGGRQPYAGLCGAVCRFRPGGSHHRRDPALVPGAGFTAAGRSSHRAPRQTRTGHGGCRAAGMYCGPICSATTALGRVQFWASISLLGGSFSWALGSVLAKKWKSAEVDPFQPLPGR